MSRSIARSLYAILGVGIFLEFFGHGVLAVKGDEKFIELITGSYDKLLGGSMSHDAATTIINLVGIVDLAAAALFLVFVLGALRGSDLAYSTVAMVLFGGAALWGFVTALSRFTATVNGADIWGFVERGPNFMLPLGLLYIVYKVREQEDIDAGPEGSTTGPAQALQQEPAGAPKATQ